MVRNGRSIYIFTDAMYLVSGVWCITLNSKKIHLSMLIACCMRSTHIVHSWKSSSLMEWNYEMPWSWKKEHLFFPCTEPSLVVGFFFILFWRPNNGKHNEIGDNSGTSIYPHDYNLTVTLELLSQCEMKFLQMINICSNKYLFKFIITIEWNHLN